MKEVLPQFCENYEHALKVINLTKNKLPYGMTINARESHVEISLLKSICEDGKPKIVCIEYNQSRAQFDAECDNACELFYKLAKHANKERLKHVVECESKATQGKCPCGYCINKFNKPDLTKLLRVHHTYENR